MAKKGSGRKSPRYPKDHLYRGTFIGFTAEDRNSNEHSNRRGAKRSSLEARKLLSAVGFTIPGEEGEEDEEDLECVASA